MGRDTGPTCKYCRRTGMKLCTSLKCASQKRNYPPGLHGPKGKPKLSEYGVQLQEKQKAKVMYQIREKQFVNYFKKAFAKTDDTGYVLMQMLETRLDNVV